MNAVVTVTYQDFLSKFACVCVRSFLRLMQTGGSHLYIKIYNCTVQITDLKSNRQGEKIFGHRHVDERTTQQLISQSITMIAPVKALLRSVKERGWKGTLTQLYLVRMTSFKIIFEVKFCFQIGDCKFGELKGTDKFGNKYFEAI